MANMDARFQVRDYVNALTGATTYRVVDLADRENPANNVVYGEKSAAEGARAILVKTQLNLGEGWNRSLLRIQRALSTDEEGLEVFVGLNRTESEKFAEPAPDGGLTDELIELAHKHREACTGYKVDPA
jgi:hypothetical protein